MKKLVLALIILTSEIFAYERDDDAFSYLSVGADSILPAISVGSRGWNDKNGFDINFSVASVFLISRLSLNASYLKKFNNNNYIGVGAGAFLAVFSYDNDSYVNTGFCPSIKLGKEYEKTFHEINIFIPQITYYGTTFLPLISYRYGF